MYLQEILEVAIGLVFLWLVISVVAMTLQEWISNLFQWRPKAMQGEIQKMLMSSDLTKQIYQHPLIAGVTPYTSIQGKKRRLPSYMPANKFSLALFDLITKIGLDSSPVMLVSSEIHTKLDETLKAPEQHKVASEDWKAIQETAHQAATSQASLDSLKSQLQVFGEKYPEVQPSIDQVLPKVDAFYQPYLNGQNSGKVVPDSQQAMNKFQLGLNAMQKDPNTSNSGETIATLLHSVELLGVLSVAQARVHLEMWFNDAMDRLSGAYKRKTQFVAFLIGFFLAVFMNIDSIHVAASLWREPTLRQAIIALAQSYSLPANTQTTSPVQSIPQLQQQMLALNIPFGWTTAVTVTNGRRCSMWPFGQGIIWGIPGQNDLGAPICKQLNDVPMDPYGWVIKLVGMLITGAAAAQGAPFWFDILKKMVNVRSTGPNPAEQTPVG
jgi:hypothetical protein